MNTFIIMCRGGIPIPKIIPNARQKLLAEARHQINSGGYSATTIRSIAKACDIGIGTVYNYFPSKDALVATFMLEDWMQTLSIMNEQISCADSNRDRMECIYAGLTDFLGRNSALFNDPDALVRYIASFRERHPQLRGQIALLIATYFPDIPADDTFLPQFLAESLLHWAIEGVPFDTVFHVLKKTITQGENP